MATAKRTRNPKSTKTAVKTDPTPVIARVSTCTMDIHEVISCRAYQLYEGRGHVDGRDLDDWLCAEAELLAQFATAPVGA